MLAMAAVAARAATPEEGQEWLRATGMRLRLARVERRLSQDDLAAMTPGVTRATVGSIERAEHPASVLAFWRLADALGMTIGELLDVEGPAQ